MRNFETGDIYLSAAISLFIETTPELKVINKRVLFSFPGDDNTYKAIAQYNAGESLNAFMYADRIKRLRSEMLLLKSGRGGAQ